MSSKQFHLNFFCLDRKLRDVWVITSRCGPQDRPPIYNRIWYNIILKRHRWSGLTIYKSEIDIWFGVHSNNDDMGWRGEAYFPWKFVFLCVCVFPCLTSWGLLAQNFEEKFSHVEETVCECSSERREELKKRKGTKKCWWNHATNTTKEKRRTWFSKNKVNNINRKAY